MECYEIKMLQSATEDLLKIIEYLSMFYENTALRQYDRIVGKIENLKLFPNMYESIDYFDSVIKYKKLVVDNYIVLYCIKDKTVEIHSIFDSRIDISRCEDE